MHQEDGALRRQLVWLLEGGGAHAPMADVLADWPVELRGARPAGQPHTPWRLLEHLRIAQHDILAFSTSEEHVSPPWPDGYWPAQDAPAGEEDWDASVAAFEEDLAAMTALVEDPATDLFAPLPWGDGQTVLREAFLVADHNAYHQAQLALLRRLLGLAPAG